jgi:GT2 family glycosyltransferase
MSLDATIIIPQFNRLDLTLRCVQSLRETNSSPPRILIVDDGSNDTDQSSLLPILAEFTDLALLPHRGVTAAWNAGLHEAQSRWVAFLNNDSVSLGPWCDRLIEPLRVGAAEMTGVAWRSERFLPPAVRDALGSPRFLTGWSFAIERSRLLDLGGFDESLTLYFSDTDLQLRLLADCKHSHPLLAVEGLPLLHHGHATTHRLPEIRRRWQQDRQRFHRLWRTGSRINPPDDPPAAGLRCSMSPRTA